MQIIEQNNIDEKITDKLSKLVKIPELMYSDKYDAKKAYYKWSTCI